MKEPQTVQIKGPIAINIQNATMLVENQASSDTPFLFEAVIYYTPLRLKSRQVRMRTGVRMIQTNIIVSIDVAAADP